MKAVAFAVAGCGNILGLSIGGCSGDPAMGGRCQESHAEVEAPEVPFEHGVLGSCRDCPDGLIGRSVFVECLSPGVGTQRSVGRDQSGGWVGGTWRVL